MNDTHARQVITELTKLNRTITQLREDHLEIGKLFKSWLEVEPEEVTLEQMDRPMFLPEMRIIVTDINHHLYRHTGVISRLVASATRVEFDFLDEPVFFNGDQIAVAPHYSAGDKVRIVNNTTLGFGEVGMITQHKGATVEVDFPNGSGGEYYLGSIELVEKADHACGGKNYCAVCRDREEIPRSISTTSSIGSDGKFIPDDLGRLYPSEWRVNLGFKPIHVIPEYSHERTLMTEEAFRIYNAGLEKKD